MQLFVFVEIYCNLSEMNEFSRIFHSDNVGDNAFCWYTLQHGKIIIKITRIYTLHHIKLPEKCDIQTFRFAILG